jgi:hypothetical protein
MYAPSFVRGTVQFYGGVGMPSESMVWVPYKRHDTYGVTYINSLHGATPP